ncbi:MULTISPECIES: ExeA family protein [unclassified Wenzhouxiangella]|uniref:ExeA family protein n=1 Tax=unclassified Wenzhouxiangella TaxID=2613841 RepID=UPI000E3264C7|nr:MULTISPECIES: AAA family ATPase [unclassified Wenzhouxiangella]RFF28287.1 AAA family ATPase [Wenzhouxiangella sp. 15181]RFP67788.1 AAA family ATPase [Wenzhouxiangella sp. 15190]
MYCEHFGLNQRPFRLTPHLAFRYPEPSQAEALTTLRVALDQGEGFIKVVGEVGLGKTLLCRTLLDELGEPFVTAWLPDPHLSPGTLRSALARDLGIELPNRPTQQIVHERLQTELAAMAARGLRPVLLIDEAQALPASTLETVRLLTNLETEQRKLLQVVLFGQPELDRRLAMPQFRQLRQRITYSCRLEPLDSRGVADYIDHRLERAGGSGELFSSRAISRIARASGGVPRLVNVLADKALLSAWGRGRNRVGIHDVRRAIGDTEDTAGQLWWPRLQPAARVAAFSLIAVGAFLVLEMLRGGG